MGIEGYFAKGIKKIFPSASNLVEDWDGRTLSFQVVKDKDPQIEGNDLSRLIKLLGVAINQITIKIHIIVDTDVEGSSSGKAEIFVRVTNPNLPPPAPEVPEA